MNCNTVKKHIQAYAEGDLSAALSEKVRAHINSCSRCARELAEYEKYFTLMSAQPSFRAPDNFLVSLHRKLDLPDPQPVKQRKKGIVKKFFLPLWPKIPLEAAGLIAVAALVFIIIRPTADIERSIQPEATGPPHTADRKKRASTEKPDLRFATGRKSVRTHRKEELRIALDKSEPVLGDRMVKKAARSAPRERLHTSDNAESVILILALNEPAINRHADEYESVASEKMKKTEESGKPSRDTDLAAAKQYRGPYSYAEKDQKLKVLRRGTERVRLLIGRYGGKILGERYNKSSGLLEMLEVSIPGERYDSFIADLRSEGTLKDVSKRKVSRRESIKLRLNIESTY